jgi:hypothetical protein
MTNFFKSSAVLSVLMLAMSGCSSADKTAANENTSTISGQFALESFPDAPTSVSAIDETGSKTKVQPSKDGKFAIALNTGHSYSISIEVGSSSEPIVFPRKDGSLRKTFDVTSSNANVNLGTIRHLDSAPSQGFSVRGTKQGDQEASECEDGIVTSTGAVCVDDETVSVCANERTSISETADDAETKDATDVAEPTESKDATDVAEPTESKDATDVAEPTESKDATDVAEPTESKDATESEDEVDERRPMAIPEHNAPSALGGCKSSDDDSEDTADEKDAVDDNDKASETTGGTSST